MTKPRRKFVFTGSGAHGRRNGAPPLAPTIGQARLGSARVNLMPGITRAGGEETNTNETKCRKHRQACCAVAAAGRQAGRQAASIGSILRFHSKQ